MADARPASLEGDRYLRPLFWRLPLVAIVVIGLAVLYRVDRLLVRELAGEAATQAVQTDALLESFIEQRVALLNGVRAQVVTARSQRDAEERFATLSEEIVHESPDLFALYLLDSAGRMIRLHRRGTDEFERRGIEHGRFTERGRALATARLRHVPATTGSIRLVSGARGMIIYVPVLRAGRLTGFIGGALDYQALFSDALAGQLQGQFAYRISDGSGELIAVSPDYPESVASTVTRAVALPGGSRWTLDVAIPPFQPFVARLVTWLVGLALIGVVVLLVLREEARARRFAAHSLELELLSRELLDANVRLEERARQIADANRAKSRFLANVSHELRTPLNAIVGYNALALEGVYGALPRSHEEAHQRIHAAAEHLLGLVNDVLDLSKIESGRLESDLQEVDVWSVLDGIVTVLDPVAEAKNVRLDLIVGRDVPRLFTDPQHLRQIVMNLVSNAIKFTEHGTVTISARRAPDAPATHVEIVVRDTGIGIAEQDEERIFEEFEQVAPSARGDSIQRGTGLGLAISRKLARVLGGDITLESRVGEGSTFTVRLPSQAPQQKETSGERALVVTPVAEPPAARAPAAPATSADEDSGEGAAVPAPARGGRGLDSSEGAG